MPKVLAIVVVYNPNISELEDNIKTYLNQVDEILLIDNSELNFKDKEILKNFPENHSKIKYIDLQGNKGIAYAQNIGYKYAIKKSFQYVLEMDQDSSLSENYIKELITQLKQLNDEKVLAISGVSISKYSNTYYEKFKSKNIIEKVFKKQSSGLLVKLTSAIKVGFKDEKLFLDFVDWEWCFRANKMGYNLYVYKNAYIYHKLGEGQMKILLFKINIPSPIRHYYQFRNTILLFYNNHIPITLKLTLFSKAVIKLILYPLILDNKKLRIKYMLKGILDGIKRKVGKIND